MRRGYRMAGALLLVLLWAGTSGCATYRLAHQAALAEENADWDAAVDHYLELVQHQPSNVRFKTALMRARLKASQEHFEKASASSLRESSIARWSNSRRRCNWIRPISTPRSSSIGCAARWPRLTVRARRCRSRSSTRRRATSRHSRRCFRRARRRRFHSTSRSRCRSSITTARSARHSASIPFSTPRSRTRISPSSCATLRRRLPWKPSCGPLDTSTRWSTSTRSSSPQTIRRTARTMRIWSSRPSFFRTPR